MRNKDTGEFELVVGDRQLLSGFFIGVLLLAVVFAMGYVLGQSSPKSAKVATETAPQTNSAAENRTPAASSSSPPSLEPVAATPPTQTAPPGQTAEAPPVDTPPQPTTVPARDTSAPPAAPPKAQPVSDLPNPNYWQVLAGSQTSADALSKTLRGQGFPVSTRPGPRDNLILVWVGPYTDKESLTRAKKQLEDAGITNLIRKQ